MRFPYSKTQIAAVVAAEKHPRDWAPLEFKRRGEASLECDMFLERLDGKDDRIRLVLRAGRADLPETYTAALLLDGLRIRGIDYHAIARSRFYKETIPKGWHEDILDPNREPGEKGEHERVPLSGFDPDNVNTLMRRVCAHWNILLPHGSETLV